VVMGDAQIEQAAGAAFDLDRSHVQKLGTLNVTLFKLLCSLFETVKGLDLCRILNGGMRGDRGSGTFEEKKKKKN
jgi:hypothetical protein